MITIDPQSDWRSGCNHWHLLASSLEKWLSGKQLPDTVLHFRTTDKAVPSDGKLHLVFGQSYWEFPGAIEDWEEDQGAHALAGKMYLRISGLPNCPDDGHIRNSEAVKKLLERLLSRVIERDPEKLTAMIATANEAERVRSREAYVKECSKRFEKTVAGTKKAINDGQAAVAQLQQDLVKKIRETRGSERKLEQLEACKGGQLAEYGQEFDKLLQVPKVLRVEAKEGKVVVYTDILYCVDPRSRKRHEIGAFRIELVADKGVPYWFNLTRRVDGYNSGMQAPHVYPDGHACLGNATEIFPELIGNYEFAAAAMVAIQFVESVNTDDTAGKHISNWPVAQ